MRELTKEQATELCEELFRSIEEHVSVRGDFEQISEALRVAGADNVTLLKFRTAELHDRLRALEAPAEILAFGSAMVENMTIVVKLINEAADRIDQAVHYLGGANIDGRSSETKEGGVLSRKVPTKAG